MNNQWHINKKGVPAVCKAKEGNCPLGHHYESEEIAQENINNQMETEYGFLPNVKMSINQKKDMADLIQRISGVKAPGFDYECYASLSIAEEMGLNKMAITDTNGLIVNLSMNGNDRELNSTVFVDKSIEAVSEYYENLGVSIKSKEALARVIYHSDNVEQGILVQSGGPNVLDAAIIKANKVVDLVEIKKLTGGAQLPVVSLIIEKDGSISEDSLVNQKPYIREAIKHSKIQDSDGTDYKVDFGDVEKNKRFPLNHFVEQYKDKGATSFVYTTDEDETINTIDLTRKTDEIVDELIKKKIEANVTLRANLSHQKVNDDDIYRFNNILSKGYSKSKRASTTDSFTLKGIKEDKITKAGKFVRVGGYILPIEYDTYKDNLNKRIKKVDLKAFKLVLTGNIKTNY